MASIPEYDVVGAGTYGAVVNPALPNNDVTKIFFDKESYKAAIKKIPDVEKFFGKNSMYYKYRTDKSFKNLPESLKSTLNDKREENKQGEFKDTNLLLMLRMPNLGVDIGNIDEGVAKELRKRPMLTILDQFVKLLSQVENLVRNRYIHGDIRDSNVMIEPSTGTLTIIDFDFLLEREPFVSKYNDGFGFYNNPPEVLIYRTDKLESYCTDFYNQFTYSQRFYKSALEGTSSLKNAITEANIKNKAYFTLRNYVKISDGHILNMFDAFGLACTLLTFFFKVYFDGSLRRDITNNEVPYTPKQLDDCLTAIKDMVDNVLLPLANFDYKERKLITDVVPIAIKIRDNLAAAMATGGGRQRKTRRSRSSTRKPRKNRKTRTRI